MAISIHLGPLLPIAFLSIYACYGNEPMGDKSMNIKLLELENEILRLEATNCGHEREIRGKRVVMSITYLYCKINCN